MQRERKRGGERGHLCSLNRAFIFGSLILRRDSVEQSADAGSFKLEQGCKLFFMCVMSTWSVEFVPQKIGLNPNFFSPSLFFCERELVFCFVSSLLFPSQLR